MSTELFDIRTHVVPCQHIREYAGATKDGVDHALQLAVKQYIPKERSNGRNLIILAAGGNGFPKEMYDPLWDDLLKACHDTSISIRSIWIADMAHQGRSGELNENRLGSDPSWIDHSRDLLALVNHFRNEFSAPIVGIGHSIGANGLINLSIIHPRLFSRLVLFEPIVGYTAADGTRFDCTAEGVHFASLAGKQPSKWPSREAAEREMSKRRPYIDFDKRVLKIWFEHGLRQARIKEPGNETVELVTSRTQEVTTYIRPLFNPQVESGFGKEAWRSNKGFYPDLDDTVSGLKSFYCPESWQTFNRLPELRPRTLFMTGGKSVMFSPGKRQAIMAITGTGLGGSGGQEHNAVDEVILPEQGHLLLFEDVQRCAEVIAEYLECSHRERSESATLSSVNPKTNELTPRWWKEVKSEVEAIQSRRKAAKL